MKEIIIARHSEIGLKGKNRPFFVRCLLNNIKDRIKQYGAGAYYKSSRYIISPENNNDIDSIIEIIRCTFGISSVSRAIEIDTDMDKFLNFFSSYTINSEKFKIETNRADKKFEYKSYDVSSIIGGKVLNANPEAKVDVNNPDKIIYIDIREHGKTYIYDSVEGGYSGMPIGSSGSALGMLSGGIDSPVAIWKMARRGLDIDYIHFHSFPYTSKKSEEKVLLLSKNLEKFLGDKKLYMINFSKVQEAIYKNCNRDYMITIMRRIMYRITESIAEKNRYQAIITGESLAQVASQTIESITATQNSLSNIPAIRPLIGMGKEDIIITAKDIGTYKTSILPYEDCCTIFLPKKPIIKPIIKKVIKEEGKIDIDLLIKGCLENIEIL